MNNISQKFKECFEIFATKCFDEDIDIPHVCKIHDAFGGMNGEHHNCLGCNFADSSNLILKFLKQYKELTDIQQDFTIYILLLYLYVERFEQVFEIISLPQTYKDKHFKIFQRIRRWANFIKHPKSFILTHHPIYDFEQSGTSYITDFPIKINEQFIDHYYSAEIDPAKKKDKNKDLYKKIHNKKDILVVFPDIVRMTENFSDATNKFVDLILKNEVYKEILNDETTLETYFENE
jgi:hypothetical protein